MENKYKLPNQANLDIISKLAYIAIVITAPFAIYNVLNQNYLLGFSASAITANFGFIAWSISKHQTYYPQIILWIFAPLLTIIIATVINMLRFTGIYGVIQQYWVPIPHLPKKKPMRLTSYFC